MTALQAHRVAAVCFAVNTLPALSALTSAFVPPLPTPTTIQQQRYREVAVLAANPRCRNADITRNKVRGNNAALTTCPCGLRALRAAGFGAATNGGPAAPGAAEAKAALENAGGDLNRATSFVFQERLSERSREDQELARMLAELSTAGDHVSWRRDLWFASPVCATKRQNDVVYMRAYANGECPMLHTVVEDMLACETTSGRVH